MKKEKRESFLLHLYLFSKQEGPLRKLSHPPKWTSGIIITPYFAYTDGEGDLEIMGMRGQEVLKHDAYVHPENPLGPFFLPGS